MKIIEVTHSFFPFSVGGREEYVFILAKGLSKKHIVKIYTTSESFKIFKKTMGKIEVVYLPCLKFKMRYSFYRIPFFLFNFLMKENFDIIHAHDFFHFTTLVSAIVARIKKKPLVVTEHGYYVASLTQRIFTWIYSKIFVRFIRNTAKKILVTSNYMKKEIMEKWGVDKRKILIVHPGIDVRAFKSRKAKGYILFIGRIVREKGLHLLIKALDKEKLIVVGPIGEEKYFENLKKLAKNKNVVFKGKVSKNTLIDLLSECNFVVIPSIYEPFGLVALEALASGKPVIAAKVGGLREILNEKVGLFFQKCNVKDLKKKIKEMKKKRFKTKKIKEIARNFDHKKFSSEIEKIYLSLI